MRTVISCHTRFDISATGIRGHFRAGQIPFKDDLGQNIQDLATWSRSRNQQRNWETLNQIISLRCLPENISRPQRIQDSTGTWWTFRFEVPSLAPLERGDDAVGWLLEDCWHVPMICDLDEDSDVGVTLDPGNDGNIRFSLEHDK